MDNIKMHVEINTDNLNIPKMIKKIDNDTFWLFAANEWRKLIEPFVPFDSGVLARTAVVKPKSVYYNTPYAARIYDGTYMNFTKTHHPLASAKWDIAAQPTQTIKLISALQNYADKKL